jgi:hypothetical protein
VPYDVLALTATPPENINAYNWSSFGSQDQWLPLFFNRSNEHLSGVIGSTRQFFVRLRLLTMPQNGALYQASAIRISRVFHNVARSIITISTAFFIRKCHHLTHLRLEFWVRGESWGFDLPFKVVAA